MRRIHIRTLVISDIHGCFDEFNVLLKKVNYNPEKDQLILLGDYVDRGLKSSSVLDQVSNLQLNCGAIILRGNHDQMMLDAFNKEDKDSLWIQNGGFSTIESYVGYNFFENGFDWDRYLEAKKFIRNHCSDHIEFLKTLKLHHEDENHIYVHAGLHPMYENWKEQPRENFIWIRDIFINNLTTVNKKVVFGHTPVINLHGKSDIWFSEDKIGIDGACAYGYQLNCLEITDYGYRTYSVSKGEK